MTDRRIFFTDANGGVHIATPAMSDRRVDETEDDFIARVTFMTVPRDVVEIWEGDLGDVPPDRTFRDAWRRNMANEIEVDMPIARTIHLDRIRAARSKELARLDIEWSRAFAHHDQTTADRIEQHRELLRQIPQTFDLSTASTPDDLNALWPDEIPR